jgi:hypothetical protein
VQSRLWEPPDDPNLESAAHQDSGKRPGVLMRAVLRSGGSSSQGGSRSVSSARCNDGEAARHQRRPLLGGQPSFTAVPEALTMSILSPTDS